jgi:AcrR family transcriptional regulator
MHTHPQALTAIEATDSGAPPDAPRRGGRPTLAEAVQLRDHILATATELFLADGYGATSIEAIARRAQISKRTFYHRFDDKRALFTAVVHSIIGRLRPAANVPLLDGKDLQQILEHLGSIILHAALAPEALALHRLLVAESVRFPDLAAIVAQEGSTDEAIRLIAGLLEREMQHDAWAPQARTFAAQQFLHMLITGPQQRALGAGMPLPAAEMEEWIRNVVNLFLNGCCGWRRHVA